MKANEFVKEYGWERAKKITTEAGYKHRTFNLDINAWQQFPLVGCDRVAINDLKRLVAAWELIQSYEGCGFPNEDPLDTAKYHLNHLSGSGDERIETLKRAIADVESCQ